MKAADLRDDYDVAVIGAGPAGLAAAALCARERMATVLFDEQSSPGGQIYRSITSAPVTRRSILGSDYWAGERLAREFLASGAQYAPEATVWSLTAELELGISLSGTSRVLRARRVIVATGAQERPFPFPGWTLPGVMTAGAAQALMKSSGVVPGGRTVLAGCGPLLWQLAGQLIEAGVELQAILDTTPRENRRAALRHFPGFLLSPYFRKGVALLAAVRSRVRVVKDVVDLRAEGEGRVESIAYTTEDGTVATLAVDNVFVHQGVVPSVNLAIAAGIEHDWDDGQLCWVPKLNANLGTSVDGIYIAGDGAGIAGAQAAAWRGVLAASDIIRSVRPASSERSSRAARGALKRFARGRRFIERLYRPSEHFRRPSGDTVVCRCEEVTSRQILEAVALGCPGPNQMKAFLRCGMGPCQGRLCGLTVTELIAGARGLPPQDIGYYRIRPPVKPVTVAELASLPRTDADVEAVVRLPRPLTNP